jgi:acetoacetyl-CoA synthetase
MVLSDSLFEWFYDTGFPKSTQLANISGGTDIAGCFALENPLTPVYVGGCQGPVLGIDLAAYEQEPTGGKTAGRRLPEGVAGELVAVTAFPNMPAKFWGQLGPEQYHSAYFSKFDSMFALRYLAIRKF